MGERKIPNNVTMRHISIYCLRRSRKQQHVDKISANIYICQLKRKNKTLIQIRLFLNLVFFMLYIILHCCQTKFVIFERNTALKISAVQCALNADGRCDLPLHTEISASQTSN